ncbi:UNVERIFIED_ORG: hypothetical protein ABIC97_001797 [Peribacillus simplex]
MIEVKIRASILEVQGYDWGKTLDVKNIENKAEQAIEKN